MLASWILLAASFAPPERYVESGILVSSDLPAIRVRVDAAFEYLGRFPIRIDDAAEGERLVFGEVRDDHVVRLFVAQFEHFLPEVDDWYRYSFEDAMELGGHRFRQNTYAYSNAEAARTNPGGESASMAAFLRGNGYRLEDELMMSRFVTVAGADKKHELILFYIENLSTTGHELSELYDASGNDTSIWKTVSMEITERSLECFEILE